MAEHGHSLAKPIIRKQGVECGCSVCFLQPMGWRHPHLGWVFLLLFKVPETPLQAGHTLDILADFKSIQVDNKISPSHILANPSNPLVFEVLSYSETVLLASTPLDAIKYIRRVCINSSAYKTNRENIVRFQQHRVNCISVKFGKLTV